MTTKQRLKLLISALSAYPIGKEIIQSMLTDLDKLPDEEASTASTWFKTLQNDPEAIIEWAQSEINEYEKLIDILKQAKK
jgi:N-acetylglucosamine kinase-like BadF-type ATPase